jgi:hypothetical protein
MTRGISSARSVRGRLWHVLLLGLFNCQTASQAADAPREPSGAPLSASSAQCGGRTQPDCPLQGWMKSTLQTYQREKDYSRLATAFQQLAEHAPDGYAHWKDAADAGAAAAAQKDDTGISKSCKGCHNEHRARFRKERRSVALF